MIILGIHDGHNSGASIFKNGKIHYPFIMVTATFAKPLKRYNMLGGQKSELIQWRYEDIQYMKSIGDDYTYQTLLNENSDNNSDVNKSKILEELFDNFEKRGITRNHLEEEYAKYPNLVIISPTLEDTVSYITDENSNEENSKDIINKNKLENDVICNIFKSSDKDNGFTKPLFVKEFLSFIKKEIYDNILKKRFKYDVFGKQHSQLWFLPTICRTNKSALIKRKEKELKKNLNQKDKSKLEKELQELKDKYDNVSIEKMTRYLAILIMDDDDFRNNFCVVVIHSQDIKNKKIDNKHFEVVSEGGYKEIYEKLEVSTIAVNDKNTACVSTKCVGDKNISECIKEEEIKANKMGKSIIILTGMRLRLGISLPCVDIALHMDPITSVDTIYQSMFRVLTERPGKEVGYFIDLLSERFVNFLYQYDNYTNKSNKNIDNKSRQRNIIDKLYTFNLNGINEFDENKTFGKVYENISKKLDLDSDLKFNQRVLNLEETNILTVFEDIKNDNPDLFNTLYKNVKDLNIDYSKISLADLKLQLEKRDNKRKNNKIVEYNNLNDFIVDDENDETTDSNSDSFEDKQVIIKNYLKDVFSLLNLFENELLDLDTDICNPSNLKDKIIEKLNYELKIEELNTNLCKNYIIDCEKHGYTLHFASDGNTIVRSSRARSSVR